VSVALHPDTPVVVDRGGLSFAQISKKNKPVPTESCLAGVKDMRLFAGDGACLFDLNAHLAAILSGAESFTFDKAVRMEFVRREVLFQDVVKGTLAKPLDGMKDLVIVRSNGAPVFHLANVCDDIAQGITHIIRGDDHVENTYRHVLLFHALGATPPRYAHLPMIVNKDGKPYSKRDGDAYVGDFREKGYFADALFNYLTLLGWSPGDDKEKMTREEAVRLFTLARIKSGPAQMDLRKLTDLNRQYVSEMPEEAFVEAAGKAIRANAWAQSLDPAYFRRVCRLLQTRTPLFSVTRDWKYFFTDAVDYDPVSVEKILKKEGVGRVLKALRERLDGAAFTLREIEAAIRETEGQFNIPEGRLNQPIRIAVTGVAQGAGIYETMAVLGKEKSLKRLGHAITHVCGAVA
jgi:glutamyl-tRNA synthetase